MQGWQRGLRGHRPRSRKVYSLGEVGRVVEGIRTRLGHIIIIWGRLKGAQDLRQITSRAHLQGLDLPQSKNLVEVDPQAMELRARSTKVITMEMTTQSLNTLPARVITQQSKTTQATATRCWASPPSLTSTTASLSTVAPPSVSSALWLTA